MPRADEVSGTYQNACGLQESTLRDPGPDARACTFFSFKIFVFAPIFSGPGATGNAPPQWKK
ncbi:MAG TPA: hypothetical protein PLJ27_08875 [Polyangiaceae bacterium]|jgi:hypothetical protein|nr:hypothetical protein [Polyangiaceae bacterium]HNZ24457.1 hypothetical protein [Polyangiaceae bacterium]HOD25337.1 hypothetical protein [Polyangiaceae bacterium]HOE50135.1 hypothetical protein [Polyangiaceae bacterium]HOH02562.1 hypothetical protein [Polyangiaceae bacterium]